MVYYGDSLYQPAGSQWCSAHLKICGVPFEVFRVVVSGSDYDVCEQFSHVTRANPGNKALDGTSRPSSSKWVGGLMNTDQNDRKVERVGALGQMAFCIIYSLHFDNVWRRYGDRYDSILNGCTIDVKTSFSFWLSTLILRKTAQGKDIPIDKDFYCCGHLVSEDRTNKVAVVQLTAFMPRCIVVASDIRPGRRGSRHLNHEVPSSSWFPIGKLYDATSAQQFGGYAAMLDFLGLSESFNDN
jgi:hypothetical protein